MFTVKHVDTDGAETVFEASDVHRSTDGKVVFGQEKVIKSGKAYIMNDAGKTVAVYDFNHQEQKHG